MKSPDTWLYPLPLPDVVWTKDPQLAEPELVSAGRCFCCGASQQHRFRLDESLVLSGVADAAEDVRLRLESASEALKRREQMPVATTAAARIRQTADLDAARKGMQQAQLAARRMALRHIMPASLTHSTPLTGDEYATLPQGPAPFALCALCHAWHALNGFAAAQGAMVWLPDLHPATVVALNRRALLAIFSGDKTRQREGKATLSALLQNRVAVEEKYRSWRPVDFAEVLRRYPPSQRNDLRKNMPGLALILTPDAFPEPSVLE